MRLLTSSLEHALRLPIAEDLIQVLGIQYPISPALQVLHCGGVQPLLHPVGQRPKALREQALATSPSHLPGASCPPGALPDALSQ